MHDTQESTRRKLQSPKGEHMNSTNTPSSDPIWLEVLAALAEAF